MFPFKFSNFVSEIAWASFRNDNYKKHQYKNILLKICGYITLQK